MTAPPSEQQLAPSVRISLGSFNFMRPSEKQVQVYAVIPGVVSTSYLLAADQWEALRDIEWIDALNEAHADWEREVFIDTSRKDKALLREWLAVDENQDALNEAWFMDRARRDPVSRSLLRDKGRLAARVAELEKRLAARPEHELGAEWAERLTVMRARVEAAEGGCDASGARICRCTCSYFIPREVAW
jgi:hypothetical protein